MSLVTQQRSSERDVDHREPSEVIEMLEARIDVLVQENRKLVEYIREQQELAGEFERRVYE